MGIQKFSKHHFFYFMGTLNGYLKWKLKINLCYNYYNCSVSLYVYVCDKVKLRPRGSEFFSSQKFWSIYFAFLKRKRINKRKCYRNWCVSGLWYMVGTEMAVDHGNSPPPLPHFICYLTSPPSSLLHRPITSFLNYLQTKLWQTTVPSLLSSWNVKMDTVSKTLTEQTYTKVITE